MWNVCILDEIEVYV